MATQQFRNGEARPWFATARPAGARHGKVLRGKANKQFRRGEDRRCMPRIGRQRPGLESEARAGHDEVRHGPQRHGKERMAKQGPGRASNRKGSLRRGTARKGDLIE